MNTFRDEYDVIIVGGGPAGSACTALLGEKYKVLLIDKDTFPRDKACGDGLSSRCMPLLRKLGVLDKIEHIPHSRIYGVTFSSPDGTRVEFPTPKSKNGEQYFFYCSPRAVFDNLLFQNAKRNAAVLERFFIKGLLFDGNAVAGVRGVDANNNLRELRSKIVVGADGALSMIREKAGLEPRNKSLGVAVRAYYRGVRGLTNKIELHYLSSVLPGYFWIFPVGNGLANVGVIMPRDDAAKKKTNVRELMLNIINHHPGLKERFVEANLTPPIKEWELPFGNKMHSHKIYGNGVLLIGDAASLIEPFAGEGISYALKSAEVASEIIDKALKRNNTSEKVLKEYDKKIRRVLGNELRVRYFLQRLASKPLLLNMILHKAQKSSRTRKVIAHTFTREEFREHYLAYALRLFLKLLFS